jgi:hypothetical protein
MKATPLVWTGLVMSALFVLFMLGASVAPKLMGMPIAGDILEGLGWSREYVLPIGVAELIFTLLYAYRPTSVLGAVLFMGLFGGAMATNLRADQPLFSHTLFSLYLGLIMWGGLWLRDEKLRALFPWRRKDA